MDEAQRRLFRAILRQRRAAMRQRPKSGWALPKMGRWIMARWRRLTRGNRWNF